MHTVAAMVEKEALEIEDTCAIIRTSSDSSKQIADPVVYQLVRVEGDGRFIPATDDEVMEVEDLLDDDDRNVMRFVLDTDPPVISLTDDVLASSKNMSDNCEGHLEDKEPPAKGERSNASLDTTVELGKLNAQFEEIAPLPEPTSDGGHVVQKGSREKSGPQLGLADSEPSTSTVCGSWKPDFSKLKGEICLENLSVRELHETFKATFGRETSVKDKQWLKRRIAMGLSNSCDVSTTTFIVEDNIIKKKSKLEEFESKDAKDRVVEAVNDSCENVAAGHDNQLEDHLPDNSNSTEGAKPSHDLASEDAFLEQRAAKRVRKPTRRYIEEVSESDCRESSGRLVSSVKYSEHQLAPRAHVRPFQNIQPIRRPLVTRQDSLGGSGVEIPYVSRIRRGRPREDFMALMKFQACGMGMEATLVKKALDGHSSQCDYEIEDKEFKARLVPGWVQQPLMKEQEENVQYAEESMQLSNDVNVGVVDSSADDSDDNIVTVPTAKGGMRRKHHRPWTLSEVVKLVEGVARYGAGRWSEIKRISFAAYSYRTSVDLKDKWRNLLRASFAQLPAEKGAQNSRKHSSIPIPAPILLRVRELAEMQSQVTPDLRSMKIVGHSSRSVNDVRSGFL